LRNRLLLLHSRDIVCQLLFLHHHLPQLFAQDIEIMLRRVDLVKDLLLPDASTSKKNEGY
jgi:hypothetical protein